MIDVYDYMQRCQEDGMSGAEALAMLNRDVAEAEADWLEEYYNRPDVQYGWHQQDMIDLHRREQ